ncbi:MAG: hypothetical protein DWQ07_10805 [Chloroflexi bacterium]|nr:MAG: hypothetical protein DWQ07_10805 [Chloroflexota bacterium]MBL1192797.1 hypothetical protein [Chloroflexota bacterium]NOH10091.1 hypothetical protein [Chloroflexota bacterium]
MNFDPQLSIGTAVVMAMLAASMWGTWAISLKYLGDHSLDGYFLTIFVTSLVFVWLVAVLLDGSALFTDLRNVWISDPWRILLTLLSGVIYTNGIRLQLRVQRTIGLSLAQPIQSSISILIGVAIAAVVGGVPNDVSLPVIILAVLVLIAAVTMGMLAGIYRSRSTTISDELDVTMETLRKSLGMILLVTVLIPAYTFALSYGLRSTTQPNGMAVLPFMAMLATGAFLGACMSSGVSLWRRGIFMAATQAPARIHALGVFSGLFHYGGNIIHTFATAFLSSVIAWPLGLTGGLWTQMWGLVYGEFRGASRRAYVALGLSVILYLVGAALVGFTLYQ